MNRIDRVVDVRVSVAVTVDGVLRPDLWHELRQTGRTRGTDGARVPAALRGELRCEDRGGHDGAPLGSLDDDRSIFLGDDHHPVAQEISSAQREDPARAGDRDEHEHGTDDGQWTQHPTTVTRWGWGRSIHAVVGHPWSLCAYRGPMSDSPSRAPEPVKPGKAVDMPKAEVESLFADRLTEAFASLGCFNLAVFGKTGVGKSTLVNAIFGSQVAETGVGRPVTRGLVYYRHPGGMLGLYDSEGFETGASGDEILEALRSRVAESRTLPVDQQIHAAWYLVRWSDRRFEERQGEFVRALSDLGLPVIMVMTQVPTRDGVPHPDALELAAYIESLGLPLRPAGNVLLTNAMEDPFTGSPAFGLQDLLDATYLVVPEVATAALTAAQILDWERKRQAAKKIITASVAVAAGVGATPIPFADAAILVPTQVTMIARITAAYGLPADRSRALAAAGAVILTGGATMAGRYIATSLLKFIPGGQVATSAISATVAGSLTRAVGGAWSRVCEYALTLPPAERDRFLSGTGPKDLFLAYFSGKQR